MVFRMLVFRHWRSGFFSADNGSKWTVTWLWPLATFQIPLNATSLREWMDLVDARVC